MAKLIRSFVKGIMNKDDDERLLPAGEFRDAQNVSIGTSQSSDVGAVENTKGNINISNIAALTANAICIGAVTNPEEAKIYWFVVDGTDSFIFEFDEINDLTSTVIHDNGVGAAQVLNFDSTYLITGVNYYDGVIYWTDDTNPPRQLNVGEAKLNTQQYGPAWGGALKEDDVSLIVKPPVRGPELNQFSNTGLHTNMDEKFIYFAYRYKYEGEQYSALSPFSASAFLPGAFTYDYAEQINAAMVNSYDRVKLLYDTGGHRVTDIQVVFYDTSSLNAYVIETINKEENGYGDGTNQSVWFDNSKIYAVLPPDQMGRLFDNVPLKAQAQEIIGRRLIFGNYVQFRDLVNNGEPISLQLETTLSASSGVTRKPSTSNPMRTFRSDRDYEIGIAYLDEYMRMTTVLTPGPDSSSNINNTLYIGPANSTTANSITVSIDSMPPSWAKYYRLFIKQSKEDYYNVFPMIYFEDGIYRWFRISRADNDKFTIGDYLICKSNARGATQSNTKYKVLDKQVQNKDFITAGEPAGLYFKVSSNGGDFDEIDLTTVTSASKGALGPQIKKYEGGVLAPFDDVSVTEHWQNVDQNVIPYTSAPTNLSGVTILTPSTSPSLNTFSEGKRIYLEITDGSGTTDKFIAYDIQGANLDIDGAPGEANMSAAGNSIEGMGNYKVKFNVTTGYTKGDRFVVNVRAVLAAGNQNALGGYFSAIQDGVLIYPIYMTGGWSVFPDNTWGVDASGNTDNTATGIDRKIQAGANIRINCSENNPRFTNIINGPQEWEVSREYANIEEWFYEDGIYKAWTQYNANGTTQGAKNVFFRRCHNWRKVKTGSSGNIVEISKADMVGGTSKSPIRMIIQGFGSPSGSQRNIIDTRFSLIQSEETLIFETDPIENDAPIFHELRGTYDIINGYHASNANFIHQSAGNPATIQLNYFNNPLGFYQNNDFNAYCWGNGLESNRIKDDFNAPTLEYSRRVSTIIEDYQQERKSDSLTYSAGFGILINGFNEFNLSTGNYKDLDISFGSIQKLYTRDSDLLVFQQDKVSRVLYQKNILTDATGGGQVASIPQVLGNQVVFPSEYGISNNPESFATWGDLLYFSDERRGVVLSLVGAGSLSEISTNGMRDYFKDLFYNNPREVKLGAVDPYNEKYVFSAREASLPCEFAISINNQVYSSGDTIRVASGSSSFSFNITSDVAWAATLVDTGDGTGWVTVLPSSGSGDGGVTYTISANGTSANRSMTLRLTACGINTDITLTQLAIAAKIERGNVIVTNPKDGGYVNRPSYDYTTNPVAGDIEMPGVIPDKGTIRGFSPSEDFPPSSGVPTPGDTVTLSGTIDTDSGKDKGFEDGLNNKLYYLVTNTEYTEDTVTALIAASTQIFPIYEAISGKFEAQFIYNQPSAEKYLYLIWDYTDNIPVGTTGSSNAEPGTSHVNLEYGSQVGRATFGYDANRVPKRFVISYNDNELVDTGYVGLNSLANYNALIAAGVSADDIALATPYDGSVDNSIGTVEFNKSSTTITTAHLTTYDPLATTAGWDGTVTTPTLTSYTMFNIGRATTTLVCADTAATTFYHNGSGATPAVGDTVYSDSAGATALEGNSLYYATGTGGPSNTYLVIDANGSVQEIGSCACGEVAIPVIDTTTIELTQGSTLRYNIQATNNPTTWSVVSSCNQYQLYGGSTGAVFSGINCAVPEAKVVTVGAEETTYDCFESAGLSILSGAADASFTSLGICGDFVLPPGLEFSNGVLIGTPTESGDYTLFLTATNCFGTSVQTSVLISINPEGLFKFKMDGSQEQDTSNDACALTATYDFYYHDGVAAYPVLNDRVYTITDSFADLRSLEDPEVIEASTGHVYVSFNGMAKWYLMDNNKAIKIARDGRVIDLYSCIAGTTKVTEVGAGGFAPGTTKTTEGGSNKTLE